MCYGKYTPTRRVGGGSPGARHLHVPFLARRNSPAGHHDHRSIEHPEGTSMRIRLSVIILLALTLSGCGLLGDDSDGLVAARARWRELGPDDHSVVQARACECLPPYRAELIVRDGRIVEARDPETGEVYDVERLYKFMPIDDLFSHLATLQKDGPARFDVSFDRRYGFPDEMHVDPDAHGADDEFIMTLSDFKPLPD